MKLYLVQHGDAVKKETDPNRPLSAQGEQDIDRLGAFLKRAGIRVERVMHSGKLRAAQTAERLATAIAPGVTLEITNLVNPDDDPKEFASQQASSDKEMLVVTHMPFVAKLVSHLVDDDADYRIAVNFQPGSAVCLEHGADARWLINWMVRPELLG